MSAVNADCEDVMKVPENIPNRNQYRNKIKSRHVDFVVFDPLSGQIDYAIELDDQTHNTPSRYKDDQLKNVAFSNAGIAGTDEGKKKLQLS